MNREDVLRYAREQGLPETATEGVFIVNTDDLGRMLLVEREACAKLCDDLDKMRGYSYADKCAAAIRARGEA
jgi:hypothetical protein